MLNYYSISTSPIPLPHRANAREALVAATEALASQSRLALRDLGVGLFFTSQLPPLGVAGVTATVVAMVYQISDIYGVSLSKATQTAIKQCIHTYVVANLAAKAIGVVPILGNIVNAAADVALTKGVGYKMVDTFETARKRADERIKMLEKINNILSENEKLRKRNEIMNEILEEMAKKMEKETENNIADDDE